MYIHISYNESDLSRAISMATGMHRHRNRDTILRTVVSNKFANDQGLTARTVRLRQIGDRLHAVLDVDIAVEASEVVGELTYEDRMPADSIHKVDENIFEIEPPTSILSVVSGLIS